MAEMNNRKTDIQTIPHNNTSIFNATLSLLNLPNNCYMYQHGRGGRGWYLAFRSKGVLEY